MQPNAGRFALNSQVFQRRGGMHDRQQGLGAKPEFHRQRLRPIGYPNIPGDLAFDTGDHLNVTLYRIM